MFTVIKKYIKKMVSKNKSSKPNKNIKKDIQIFIDIIKGNNIGDNNVYEDRCLESYSLNLQEKFGIIVLATKSYFSERFINSVRNYASQGLPIVIAVDRTVKNNTKISEKIKKISSFKNVRVLYLSRDISYATRIKICVGIINCEYIQIFTMKDVVNRRSYYNHALEILTRSAKDIIIETSVAKDDFINRIEKIPYCSSLKNIYFRKEFLLSLLEEIDPKQEFWLARIIFEKISMCNVDFVYEKLPYTKSYDSNENTIIDIAHFIRDSIMYIHNHRGNDYAVIKKFIFDFHDAVNDFLSKESVTEIKRIFLASGSALVISEAKEFYDYEEYQDILYLFASLFSFDAQLNNEKLQKIHHQIVNSVIEVDDSCVSVVETRFMEDLKESFVPELKKHYKVIYTTKPQYYDYHYFNCMVMRAEIQPSKYVITSNDMHKFITGGKKVITLWHGLGMMKKIAEADREKYPLDYIVTSSEACQIPWSKTFQVPVENVLPLGQVQTDILHNTSYVDETRKKITEQYGIPKTATIIFFAPTFRIGDGKVPGTGKYYDFMIDIEELSKKLAQKNIYIITKRHHVFLHILKDKGVDVSGVFNSINGHFIVDEEHSFVELMCCADMFMTDYSSGMFYALIRNIPLILYAPDVESYKEGSNGFMISYPEEVPAPFVGKPDVNALITAIEEGRAMPSTPAYSKFKEDHVGACDGRVAIRLAEFMKNFSNV